MPRTYLILTIIFTKQTSIAISVAAHFVLSTVTFWIRYRLKDKGGQIMCFQHLDNGKKMRRCSRAEAPTKPAIQKKVGFKGVGVLKSLESEYNNRAENEHNRSPLKERNNSSYMYARIMCHI